MTRLDQLDRLIAITQRCTRLAAVHPDTTKSPELARAVIELRVALGADGTHAELAGTLLAPTIEGLRTALAIVAERVTGEQRTVLKRRSTAA